MLTLTPNASTVIKEIARQEDDVVALRISTEPGDEPAFAISAVAAAEPGDAVVEQDGATLYLDAPTAAELDDKALDASVDEEGGVQFGFAQRA